MRGRLRQVVRSRASLAVLVLLVFVPSAGADNGVDITPTEGQNFSGRVLTSSCKVNAATIDWGDGTAPSAGTPLAGGQPGASGSHTYAEEGTYTGTVTYSPAPGPISCTSTQH